TGKGTLPADKGLPKPPDDPPKKEPKKEDTVKPPDDPNVLTVSQDPKDGGNYQTIRAALEQAKPGQTIRVLDAKTYPEVLAITQASRHAGITLEAPHRATLAPGKARLGLDIANVHGVTVRGFRFQPGPDTLFLIGVRDQATGVVLEDLEFLANQYARGIGMEHLPGEGTDAPVRVRRCVFRGLKMGIQIIGSSDTGKPTPCGRILVQNNDLKGCDFGV